MNVSVIICTYNRSESLRRTLQSLKEMSVSDNIGWELLIVDNNSTDKTKEVVNDFIKVSDLIADMFLRETGTIKCKKQRSQRGRW